jgi:DNA helicase IV
MNTSEWSGNGWPVSVTDAEVALAQVSGPVIFSSTDAARLEVRRRWFRWSLHSGDQPLVQLRGITKTEASALSRAVRRLAVTPAIADAVAWYAVTELLAGARTEQRWIPAETAGALLATRPEPGLVDRVRAAGCEPSLTAGQLEAVTFLDADLESVVADTNEQIVAGELSARRPFFDTIEKTPLSEEQARAVVCFDNRVQVLAAAGSGKTSVMVARAPTPSAAGSPPLAASCCWRSTRLPRPSCRTVSRRGSRPPGSTRPGCGSPRSIPSGWRSSAGPPARSPAWRGGWTRAKTWR